MNEIKQISVTELQKKLDDPNTIIVNVLAQNYYDDCHIKGSICIPLAELKNRAQELDKNKNIVVYCASYSCPASKEAYKLLHSLSFENLVAYEGGTKEWKEKKLPTEGTACQ